jgi:hypothetical protein
MKRDSLLSRAVEALRGCAAHRDPRTALANTVALVVASNQPFYPLYLHAFVSPIIWPSYATFLSTPFFLAVPALARRSALLGRSALLVAGIGNTLICRAMFGPASGVEVFLFPCLALAASKQQERERAFAYGFAAVAGAVYLLPASLLGVPAHLYEPAEYTALSGLNFTSAAMLTALIALLFANAFDLTSRTDETESARAA